MNAEQVAHNLREIAKGRQQGISDDDIGKALQAATGMSIADLESEASSWGNVLRLFGQGLTLGFSDEAAAGVRSVLGEDYDAALRDERSAIENYRSVNPLKAAGVELGGAAAPAAIAGLLSLGAGAPAVLGATAARAAPSLARVAAKGAALGAAEGGAYGFGSGEGGLANRAIGSALGAAGGTVGGAAGGTMFNIAGSKLSGLTDWARRKVGGKASSVVAAEVQRIADDTGLTIDEIVDRVASGEILGDMSTTTRATLRGYKAHGDRAANEIEPVLTARAQRLRKEALGEAQDVLGRGARAAGLFSGDTDVNILRLFRDGTDAIKQAEGLQYQRIWQQRLPAGQRATQEIQRILRIDKSAADDALSAMSKMDDIEKPFFNMSNGKVNIIRQPTLHEAEIIRRTLANKTDAAFRNSQSEIAGAYQNLERRLRSAIDESSPELAQTRARWADMKAAGEMFDAGRKAMSANADDIEIQWSRLLEEGNQNKVAAFRAGLAQKLRDSAQGAQGKSLAARLIGDERKEALIFQKILPPEESDRVVSLLERAANAQRTYNDVVKGSQTAETLLNAQKQGSAVPIGAKIVSAAGDPSLATAVSLLNDIVKAAGRGLSQRERDDVVRLLLEENPNIVRRALVDDGGLRMLQNVVEGVVRGGTAGAAAAGGVVGSKYAPAGLLF